MERVPREVLITHPWCTVANGGEVRRNVVLKLISITKATRSKFCVASAMDSSLKLLSIPILITVNIIFNGCCSSLVPEERQDGTKPDIGEQNQGSAYFVYQSLQYPRDCQEVLNQCSSPAASGVYLVKPEGYLDPFEVYCDNQIDDGGWTVIQRRIDGSLDFGRYWEDYKKGFGFLSSEFWLGNDHLAFLTNQAQYELRVDVTIANETSFSIRYDAFRLGVCLFQGSLYTECPANTIYTNCTCVATCEDPLRTSGCRSDCNDKETCMCRPGYLMKGDDCVELSECGCYLPEERIVIPNGDAYVNVDCSKRCTCSNDVLSCDANYQCGSNAACLIKDAVRQCYCNRGYEGDGQTCTASFTDCTDVYNAGHTQDGVYPIHPSGWTGTSFNVFCNMTIDGGSWTVFQRRKTGSTTFYKTWGSYKNGFGNIQHEFWLGNEKLHYLTQQATYELRIDIVSDTNALKYSKFARFRVDDETHNYRLTQLTSYSGNAGNGMDSAENIAFSTHDRDNDGRSWDCADKYRGGWWYGGKNYDGSYRYCDTWPRDSNYVSCAYGNLNGDYSGGIGENIFWY
ncbi:Tenascin-R [Holothuria leucospilota]|uniref:Tenascin-R n=1 Tax=Holothuria leucospilota TaxID=206669 RepID=A0A9Q1BWT7_HOLLE|nr:Tenascin-R [Holothuria leucospilota]